MERFQCSLFLLFIGSACAQYGDSDQYPTAKIALMDNSGSEGSGSKYALQVSSDQLQEYLKALKHVPESVYSNGAHIIADMEESALPESLSASRYDSDQDSESRDQVDLRSLIPAVRLDRHHLPDSDTEDRADLESRRRSFVYDPDEERYDRPPFKRPSTRELLRDLMMRREDIAKADLPSPSPVASAQAMDDHISHVKEAIKEAKALQAAEVTEALKGKVVEALKKDAEERKQAAEALPSKDYATASTVRVPEIDKPKYKEEDRPDKYRAQESENKYKSQDHYPQQEAVIKVQASDQITTKEINSPEHFMGRVQIGKSLHYNEQQGPYERENRSDTLDIKTVRELLSTLIKQIENIQSAAKTLTSVSAPADYSFDSKKSTKGYNKPHYQEEERPKKRKPLPYDMFDSYTSEPSYAPKKSKRLPKAERTVYLKPHEVMKLLEPDTYEPLEVPIRRPRPYAMGASSSSMRRIPFPGRRAMFPSFYPGITAQISCCDEKCATNFGFSPSAGYKK